jgi:hypothetical protein
MLLRFQKAGVRGNSETGNQAFSMHLRFLTILVGADSCPPAPVTRSTAQVRAIVRHETYVVDLKRFLSLHHYPAESDRSEIV